MATKRLTDKAVERMIVGPGERRQVYDSEVGGLVLRVSAGKKGADGKGPRVVRTWSVLYRVRGAAKMYRYTIGRADVVGVADAREEARKVLRAARDGADPTYVLARERADAEQDRAKTVAAAFGQYVEWLRDEKRNRTWAETERKLRTWAVPAWGAWPLSGVQSSDVRQLRDNVAKARGRHAARTLVSAISAMYRWAIDDGLADENPAAAVTRARVGKRKRTLKDAEIADLWRAADRLGYPAGAFLKMLLCTGARRDEIAKMRWGWLVETAKSDEYGDDGLSIAVPAEHHKGDASIVIPLSTLAAEVLATVPRHNDPDAFVFAGNARRSRKAKGVDGTLADVSIGGFTWARRKIDTEVVRARRERAERAGENPDEVVPLPHWTFHDLRRTVRTNLPRLGVDPFIAERVLGHTIRGIDAHYDLWSYAPQKRQALEKWAGHLRSVVAGDRTMEAAA